MSYLSHLSASFLASVTFFTLASESTQAQVSVLTQHNDNFRDGVNSSETILTPANVNVNQFGLLFKIAVDDQVYAQPLIDSSVNIGGGTHRVVYVATANNSVYAFDADNGQQYWKVNLGIPITASSGKFSCQDVLGSSGIMSTPVIDTATGALYVVTETFSNGVAAHQLHALNLSTGQEQLGGPVEIQASGFRSTTALQRTGLLLANGILYFSFASHCDQGSYKGITFAYDASTLTQTGSFNAAPDDNGAGIWQSGNGDAADASGNVYWVTGNGGWDGVNNFGETVLKANPNLQLLDWHTPSNYSSLNAGDVDLTGSGPVLLPGTDLLVAGGKGGVLYLINTGNMGHLGDAGAVETWSATSSHIHSLVYFNANLYLWGQSDYLKVFPFNGSTFAKSPSYTGSTQAIGHPGSSLSISANGAANGILWAATNSQGQSGGLGAWHATEPGILYAYGLPNMAPLWNSHQNAMRDDCNNYAKFIPPTIANGKVYLPSFGTAQTNSGQLCVYGQLSAASNLVADGTYLITSVHSGQAIDDPGFSTTYGKVMTQYPVNNGTNQQWVVHNLGSNIITLTNVASTQVLEVTGGSKSNSALVDQYPYQSNPWQQWQVISVGNGAYELTNVNSGQALDVDGGGTTAGEQLDQYPYKGVSWQQWKFTRK